MTPEERAVIEAAKRVVAEDRLAVAETGDPARAGTHRGDPVIPTYKTLLALFRAFQAAEKAWLARPMFTDFTNMKSEANLAIYAEHARLGNAQTAAREALTAEYERTVSDRERALVDAGQGTACCCCDGITGAEAWCNVTFGAGS